MMDLKNHTERLYSSLKKRWLAKTLRTLKLGRLERCKVKDIFAEI